MAGPLKQPNALIVYNVLGQAVLEVHNIITESTSESSSVNTDSLPCLEYDELGEPDTVVYALDFSNFQSGIYFYRISTPDTSITRKFVLLK